MYGCNEGPPIAIRTFQTIVMPCVKIYWCSSFTYQFSRFSVGIAGGLTALSKIPACNILVSFCES